MTTEQQAAIERLSAENALLQLQIERIRQETIEDCLRVVEGERLHDNTGEPEDIGYAAAIDDVIAAIRLQGAGQPKHLPVQASAQGNDELAKLQKRIDELEKWEADAMRDRDCYHEWADDLAAAISKLTGVDIGEHSNMNNPWSEALEAIENYAAAIRSLPAQREQPTGAAHGVDDSNAVSIARTLLENGYQSGHIASQEAADDLLKQFNAAIAALPSAAPIAPIEEREAFEKFVSDSGRAHMLERDKRGWYIDLNVTAWFAGWMGRAALAAPALPTWISVEEQLPEDETPVLILRRGEVDLGELVWERPGFEDTYEAFRYWDRPNDDGQGWEWDDITHWMPFPNPPAAPIPADPKNHLGHEADSKR